jgi:hypothetical protein
VLSPQRRSPPAQLPREPKPSHTNGASCAGNQCRKVWCTIAAGWPRVRAMDASGGKHACSDAQHRMGGERRPCGRRPARQGHGSSVIRDRLAHELGGRADLVFAASASAAQSRCWQREQRLVNFGARSRHPDAAAYFSRAAKFSPKRRHNPSSALSPRCKKPPKWGMVVLSMTSI